MLVQQRTMTTGLGGVQQQTVVQQRVAQPGLQQQTVVQQQVSQPVAAQLRQQAFASQRAAQAANLMQRQRSAR